MVQELAARDQEIERLKALIDKLKRTHFGRKSEQLDRQIENLETRFEDLTGEDKAASSKESAPRVPLPPYLLHEENRART